MHSSFAYLDTLCQALCVTYFAVWGIVSDLLVMTYPLNSTTAARLPRIQWLITSCGCPETAARKRLLEATLARQIRLSCHHCCRLCLLPRLLEKAFSLPPRLQARRHNHYMQDYSHDHRSQDPKHHTQPKPLTPGVMDAAPKSIPGRQPRSNPPHSNTNSPHFHAFSPIFVNRLWPTPAGCRSWYSGVIVASSNEPMLVNRANVTAAH